MYNQTFIKAGTLVRLTPAGQGPETPAGLIITAQVIEQFPAYQKAGALLRLWRPMVKAQYMQCTYASTW